MRKLYDDCERRLSQVFPKSVGPIGTNNIIEKTQEPYFYTFLSIRTDFTIIAILQTFGLSFSSPSSSGQHSEEIALRSPLIASDGKCDAMTTSPHDCFEYQFKSRYETCNVQRPDIKPKGQSFSSYDFDPIESIYQVGEPKNVTKNPFGLRFSTPSSSGQHSEEIVTEEYPEPKSITIRSPLFASDDKCDAMTTSPHDCFDYQFKSGFTLNETCNVQRPDIKPKDQPFTFKDMEKRTPVSFTFTNVRLLERETALDVSETSSPSMECTYNKSEISVDHRNPLTPPSKEKQAAFGPGKDEFERRKKIFERRSNSNSHSSITDTASPSVLKSKKISGR